MSPNREQWSPYAGGEIILSAYIWGADKINGGSRLPERLAGLNNAVSKQLFGNRRGLARGYIGYREDGTYDYPVTIERRRRSLAFTFYWDESISVFELHDDNYILRKDYVGKAVTPEAACTFYPDQEACLELLLACLRESSNFFPLRRR